MRKILYVRWIDACSENGWIDLDPAQDLNPVEVDSVGFLIKDEPDYLSLSVACTNLNTVQGYLTIPKAWIKKKKFLKV